jgi:glycosyltransferase involved in cell wall biosynthesis
MNTDVSIIIPAFNECETIGKIVGKLRADYPKFEIIVVDDGSNDDTHQCAANAGAIVYRHPYNIGNGAAVKTGIRAASGKTLLFMDADGQHDPDNVREMLSYIPEYDMVVGARKTNGQASVGRALGNTFYNWLASYVAKFKIQDLTSGFRAVKADIVKGFLHLLPNTYSYPTTITLGVLRSGFSVKYMPINTSARKAGKSNIKLFSDGLRFFIIITKICTLYSPMRIFLPVSFLMFMTGLCYYMYTYFAHGRFTNMSALLFTNAVMLFMMGLISEQICQMRFERRNRANRSLSELGVQLESTDETHGEPN